MDIIKPEATQDYGNQAVELEQPMTPEQAREALEARRLGGKPTAPASEVLAEAREQTPLAWQANPEPRIIELEGREWTIDPTVFDDAEVMERLSALHGVDNVGQQAVTVLPMLRDLLGNEQYDELKELNRSKVTGRVSMTKMVEFFAQVPDAINPN